MIYNYPALFTNDGGKVAFRFYDIEELHSFGDDLDEAILAAKELLAGHMYAWENDPDGNEFFTVSEATPLERVHVKDLEVIKMIEADTRRRTRNDERPQRHPQCRQPHPHAPRPQAHED